MDEPFKVLIGSQLASVEFVQDYLQLHFDGPSITGKTLPTVKVENIEFKLGEWHFNGPYIIAITLPTVKVENIEFKLGECGYRDALCGRIAKIVVKAWVIEKLEVYLEFDDSSSISISLRDEDYVGPEAVEFGYEDEGRRQWGTW